MAPVVVFENVNKKVMLTKEENLNKQVGFVNSVKKYFTASKFT